MKFHKLVAAGLGTGYSPIAPGTAGAILGIVMLFVVNKSLAALGCSDISILILNLALLISVTLLSLYSVSKVHQVWEHDDSKIVIDEVVGVWLSALYFPLEWQYYALALLLFRFFDIAKPLFIRRLDKLKTDWSVIFDDLLAGLYALISGQIIIAIINNSLW